MYQDLGYFAVVVFSIILGVVIVKKVASCLLRTIGLIILVAILIIAYFVLFGSA